MLIITLRLIHIVFGAMWIGFAAFGPMFLMPAIQDAGPDGGKVMQGLMRRGLMTVMPILAISTLISGFWLYWIVSSGMDAAYMRSRMGMALGTGGTLATVAFLLGVMIVRPSMLKSAQLMQSGGDKAEAQRLRERAGTTNRVVAMFLILAVSAMAIARYL